MMPAAEKALDRDSFYESLVNAQARAAGQLFSFMEPSMPFSRFKSSVLVRTFIEAFQSTIRWYMRFVPWFLGMTVVLLVIAFVALLPDLVDRYFDHPAWVRPAGQVVSVHAFGRAFTEYTVIETDLGFYAVAGLVTVGKGQKLSLVQYQNSTRLCMPAGNPCKRLAGVALLDPMSVGPAAREKQ